jgi:hypothetical protein
MGEPAVGKDCKLYYNSGTHAAPVWVEIKEAIDLNVPLTKGRAEAASRKSGWKTFGAGLKEAGLEFGYLHEKGADTVFDVLLSSYISDVVKEFACMDQAIATSGAQGLRFFGQAFEMTQAQELEGAVQYNFVIAPTRKEESGTLIEPDWYEVP